mmetsp:Transcript_64030/g.198235  ORF Transcript_64030/g.198235 Transcript_64030/m.198235 type:complete len:135 (-) Transcript_64030:118-522(-)
MGGSCSSDCGRGCGSKAALDAPEEQRRSRPQRYSTARCEDIVVQGPGAVRASRVATDPSEMPPSGLVAEPWLDQWGRKSGAHVHFVTEPWLDSYAGSPREVGPEQRVRDVRSLGLRDQRRARRAPAEGAGVGVC